MTADAPVVRRISPWERRLTRAGMLTENASATREDIIWFIGVFALSLAGGAWLVYGAEVFVGDALSRAANAHHVVLSRDPHLAAIGFIWPPLPSFLEIPFVLLLRPLGLALLAPQVVGALFTAAMAVLLNRTFLLVRVSDWRRWLLTGSIMLNPLVLYGAINGMTENIFLFFVLGTAYYLLIWLERSATTLIVVGSFVGLSFFVRYEGLALGAGGLLALLLLTNVTEDRDRGEAMLIAFLAPLALTLLLWAFWNALFVNDPLYFLRSVGSNEFYTGGIREADAGGDLARAYQNIPRTAIFAVRRLWSVAPLFLPAVAAATVVAAARRDRVLAVLLSVGICLPAFAIFQVYRGELFEWVRFWQPAVLFAPLLAAAALRHLPIQVRRHALTAVAAVVAVSGILTAITMGGSISSPDERQFIGVVSGDLVGDANNSNAGILDRLREAAAAIDALPEVDGRPPLVAIDTFVHATLVLLVDHPDRLAIVSDRDFNVLLDDVRARVDYILMPEPVGISADTDLNRRFPGLYQAGGSFVELVEEFDRLGGHGDARLYRILRQRPGS